MRSAHIWKVEGIVNLLCCKCSIHRIDNHILITSLLNKHLLGSEQITLGLNRYEILTKGSLIGFATLKGVQEYGLLLIELIDIVLICHKSDLANRAYSLGVKAIWNFAPIDLNFGSRAVCENINMSESLMRLIYKSKKIEN
jgi:hypothetical protein